MLCVRPIILLLMSSSFLSINAKCEYDANGKDNRPDGK